METKIRSPSNTSTEKNKICQEEKRSILGGIVHHISMFVIGCAIGAVLTMLYTSFLPIGQPDRMSQHRRIMTRDVHKAYIASDLSIFSDLRKPAVNPRESRRMKRAVPVPATAKPPAAVKNSTNKPPGTTPPTVTTSPTLVTKLPVPKPPTTNDTHNVTVNHTDICPFTDFAIKSKCEIPFQLQQLGLMEMTLHDVISSVISPEVEAGWDSCKAGLWCPRSQELWDTVSALAERWGNGNFQAQICPLLDCLNKLPNASTPCENSKRKMVTDTVTLLCSMPLTRETKLRDITCVKRVLMLEHRDVSDLSRANATVAKNLCSNTKDCKPECNPLFTEFADLDLACDSYRYYIRNFGPWKWFYQSRLKQNCDVQPSIGKSQFSFAFIGKYKIQIMIFVSVTTVVLIMLIAGTSVFFWRRRRVEYKRTPMTESELAEMEGLLIT